MSKQIGNLINEMNCPYCSGKVLKTEVEAAYGIVKYSMISYICNICMESFTTTESDSISLDRYIRAKKQYDSIKRVKENIKEFLNEKRM